MNLTQFLEELRKTRDGWSGPYIITKTSRQGKEYCPVTAVCMRVKKARFGLAEYEAAGIRLGLSPQLTRNIARAADGQKNRLRSRLLKAVGL